jgi:hypothetical protein
MLPTTIIPRLLSYVKGSWVTLEQPGSAADSYTTGRGTQTKLHRLAGTGEDPGANRRVWKSAKKWARPISGEMNAPGEEINEGEMKLSPPQTKIGLLLIPL